MCLEMLFNEILQSSNTAVSQACVQQCFRWVHQVSSSCACQEQNKDCLPEGLSLFERLIIENNIIHSARLSLLVNLMLSLTQ